MAMDSYKRHYVHPCAIHGLETTSAAYRNMAVPARKTVARAPLARDTAEAPLVVEEVALELEPDVLAEDREDPELPESALDTTWTLVSSLALEVDSVPASESELIGEPASLSEAEDDADPADASDALAEEPVPVADSEATDDSFEAEVDAEVAKAEDAKAEDAEAEPEVEEFPVQ